MHTTNDIHQQFAEYFRIPALKPYAYLLSKRLSEGHICLNLDNLGSKSDELPEWYRDLLSGREGLSDISLVATDDAEGQPFILQDNRLYLQRYFRYETMCIRSILRFIEEEKATLATRTEALLQQQDFIKELFSSSKAIPATDWQFAAAITGVLNNFSIITGGPGTGKTTTVAKLLAILYRITPLLKVALAAPTGKAAARMADSLRNTILNVDAAIKEQFQALKPSTIHRLLKWKKDSPYFHHNAEQPLPFDVIVVDESSMIDLALFAKLMDAVGPGTRLILLGDKDQLTSVEAGSLFGDLCLAQKALNRFSGERAGLVNQLIELPANRIPDAAVAEGGVHPLFEHVVELQYSHRFVGDKGIGVFSKAVIQNDVEKLRPFIGGGGDEQVIFDTVYAAEAFEDFIQGYSEFIVERNIGEALKKFSALRVLCAVREGHQGVYTMNRTIEASLQRSKRIDTKARFYENRPLILTRNYYEHGLFNGDTGIIRQDADGKLMAWFEDGNGGLKAVLPGYLTDAETAFAMTIHKSQGSEFNKVLIVLPQTTDSAVLTRELLYTAITRAKYQVLIQGTEEVLMQSAERSVERASGIADRLSH